MRLKGPIPQKTRLDINCLECGRLGNAAGWSSMHPKHARIIDHADSICPRCVKHILWQLSAEVALYRAQETINVLIAKSRGTRHFKPLWIHAKGPGNRRAFYRRHVDRYSVGTVLDGNWWFNPSNYLHHSRGPK